MNTSDLQTPATAAASIGNDIASIHDQLTQKYAGVNPSDVKLDANSAALMSFNGYYSLNATGAFFTIDTNMLIQNGSTTPIYDISLIISLDGINSSIYPFQSSTGTFDGANLHVSGVGLPTINLAFTRGGSNGATATFTGSIQMPSATAASTVNGVTYNNIVPMSIYQGEYYENVILFDDPMMTIDANYGLQYKTADWGAQLTPVSTYIYNMNMYYFSFVLGTDKIKLIMGTSAAGGMICSAMTVPSGAGAAVQARTFQTVKKCSKAGNQAQPNLQSADVAQFAGFYAIASTQSGVLQPGAFVSVEGKYTVTSATSDLSYLMEVGVSLDGVTVDMYYLDTTTTITENSITIPAALTGTTEITLNFESIYTPDSSGSFGSLASLSGTLAGAPITGTTPLSPVPLEAFAGTLTSLTDASESITIHNNQLITFNGTDYSDFVYVPLMYILAAPSTNPQFVLSLGTAGGKGVACITTVVHPSPVITVVTAIPSGQSGQPPLPTA